VFDEVVGKVLDRFAGAIAGAEDRTGAGFAIVHPVEGFGEHLGADGGFGTIAVIIKAAGEHGLDDEAVLAHFEFGR